MSTRPDVETLLELYRYMRTARELDALEEEFTKRGEAFFHVSGAGHEGTAAIAPHLTSEDWLHCHYRDKALMLARGVPSSMFFHSLFCKDASHSRGRQMSAHLSDPERKILSLVGPVGSSALPAVGVAEEVKGREGNPIVLCGLGDGTSQQGEVLEAVGHAVRNELPVLFMIQDNALAISTRTNGRTFYSRPDGDADAFYGIPIIRTDGCDIEGCYRAFADVVAEMRRTRKPAIVVFRTERLTNHTNADDQRVYRSAEEIETIRATCDPLLSMRSLLLSRGVAEERLDGIDGEIRERLRDEARESQRGPDPEPMYEAKRPLDGSLTEPAREYRGLENEKQLTMIESIREVLRYRMRTDERVTLFGEDIADPKGDVFGVTRGLTDEFPGRVENSPLSESTIVGVSAGRALAGGRPVAFLQFADFLPLAYNQIFAEMGSMWWRTDGGWKVPMIVMITCGGYRPGLGPFHASTLESVAVHTPGVDVFMPSSAADAAGLLQAAFDSERPTLFFYPKNCLNDREAATSRDVARQFVPIGRARTLRSGNDITLVGWGNTVGLLRKAADTLEEHDVGCDLIDLRSLSPWDRSAVVASVERTGRLLVAHEDNHTAGFGAEVAAAAAEYADRPIAIRRVTRADTYVPCNFANQLEVLPSYRRILETAVRLLGGSVEWDEPAGLSSGSFLVEAIGSSPSDESVTVLQWHVSVGDEVAEGRILADLEADKASQELVSPVTGVVDGILVPEGDTVKVGTPILSVRTAGSPGPVRPATNEVTGTPRITGIRSSGRKEPSAVPAAQAVSRSAGRAGSHSGNSAVGIVRVTAVSGSRVVENPEISETCPAWSPEDIVRRTGILRRHWAADGEDAVSLAEDAARRAVTDEGIDPRDIGFIVCATGTPVTITPSTACLVQERLIGGGVSGDEYHAQAFDINAACSGYIYALQAAHDYLVWNPGGTALVLTTETLSRKTDPSDPMTAPIFGDAATATLLVGSENSDRIRLRVHRPSASARGENGSVLAVPLETGRTLFMDGPKVFLAAVRDMIMMLESACTSLGLSPEDLDLVVPHQANQRIINAIRQKLSLPREKVYSNIREYGNTSSSSIPICLEEILSERENGTDLPARIGLCAFGGGFTFAGAVLESMERKRG